MLLQQLLFGRHYYVCQLSKTVALDVSDWNSNEVPEARAKTKADDDGDILGSFEEAGYDHPPAIVKVQACLFSILF